MCDCDGTLINSNQTISQSNVNSIKKLLQNNIHFAISTGRFRFGCRNIYKQLQIEPSRISSSYDNGSCIDIHSRHVFDKSVSRDSMKKIVALCENFDCAAVIYGSENWYISKKDKWYDAVDKFYPGLGIVSNLIEKIDSITSSSIKISIRGKHESLYELSKIIESDFPSLKTFLSRSTILEVVNKDIDKGFALKFLASYFGIDMSQTMAIGDYNNDIDMIKAAGIGIAMENAGDEVKKNATYITSSNDDDGVCKAIEKFVFEC